MASLNNNNRKRPIHVLTPLTHRKGKQRLRPLTLKQLHERLESAQLGKHKDMIRKEMARKVKLGLQWNPPVIEEATEE